MSDGTRDSVGSKARRAMLGGAGWAVAAALVLAACAGTATPPPVTQPAAPEPPRAPAVAPEVTAYVRVAGSKLNVREAPNTSARTVAKVARGTRLEKRGEEGEWVEVVLASGVAGWVSGRFVTADAPCQPDSVEPEVASAVPVGVASDSQHGRIVIEATVTRAGDVASVEVKENTTGSGNLAEMASAELHQMKFKPFMRACRAVPFIYVFTRNF